jgi:hypothetical protein
MGGFIMNEQKLVNDNVFLHEDRLNSQYTRFLEKSPTYVTYFNINNIETTVDNGFNSVERVIGANSPVRYNEVKDFPIYGIDQIVLALSEEQQGIDSNYDGEAVILPNTITPLPNDMFIIDYLDQNYVFMVTEISYDTIKSNNYYRIEYTLKSVEPDFKENLLKQTSDKFDCIVDNIGTQEKAIIRSDEAQQLRALDEIYTQMVEHYQLLFYNKLYNSFLLLDGDKKIYDKYVTEFINQHSLFNKKHDYSSMVLTIEDNSPAFPIEYHRSFFRAVELHKKKLVKPYIFSAGIVSRADSIFSFYRDQSVRSVQLGVGENEYLSTEFIEMISTPPEEKVENVLEQTVIDFFNDSIKGIYELDMEKLDNYMDYMEYDRNTFVLIPVVLYILRFYYDKFMTAN